MLTIIKKILIVLIAVVIVDQVFTYAFINFIFVHTISGESGGTLNYVIEKKPDLDFLIMGPSRAKNGIDPTILTSLGKNGHNLGINGTTVLHTLLELDILLSRGVHPKTIVLVTDEYNYGTDSVIEMTDQVKRLYTYDTPLIREYVHRLGVGEEMKYFFGTYRLNRKIANIGINYIRHGSVGEYSGYVGLPNPDYHIDAESFRQNIVYTATSTNREALFRFKQLCDEHNIKLIVLFMPSYHNVLTPRSEQARMVADLEANGFGNILDLSDVTKFHSLEPESMWRDAIHLNATGSQAFSNILNNALKQTTSK
jgi:hypothetical protein